MTTETLKKGAEKKDTAASNVDSKTEKPRPARVFRDGAIAASVWQRQTGTGFAYFDFSVSRSWKSSTSGKEGYSTNFFPQNAESLVDVIQQASDWIIEQMTGTIDPTKSPTPDVRQAA